jgi:hypothetical protein
LTRQYFFSKNFLVATDREVKVVRTLLTHQDAVELGNALLDAAEIAAETGEHMHVNRVINCYVAMSECDGVTHIKVLAPPIPLGGTGDTADIKKPLKRGAA